MNILHLNSTDLIGGRFTGYYMQQSLDSNYIVEMAVWKKDSDSNFVHLIPPKNNFFRIVTDLIIKISSKLGFDRLIAFGGWLIINCDYFKKADIVHIHLIHNSSNISILSLPMLSRRKPIVWTIHDPWAMTGGCEHSFDCNRWVDGCFARCPHPRSQSFFKHYTPYLHWKVKKWIFKKSNISLIVASQWMEDRMLRSKLLKHLPCYRVPFGIDIELFKPKSKIECKNHLGISPDHKVIAFRDVGLKNDRFKGMLWLLEALKLYDPQEPTTLLIFQDGKDFEFLSNKYNIVKVGWVDGDEMVNVLSAADIFLMPSIQESFGLMAVEAMACAVPVIVFDGTALTSVINDSSGTLSGGIVVPTKDSYALSKAIKLLLENDDLRMKIGEQGRQITEKEYSLELYVKRHVEIYEKVIRNYNCGYI